MRALVVVASAMAGVVACVGTAGCASQKYSAPTELRMDNVLQRTLAREFTPGREVVVSYIEIPPHTTMERHWHPGEEFHYYLEGRVEIVIDGHPTIVGTPGTVGHVPYRVMHTAVTGPEGARAIVFRVHTEGEPVRYLESGTPGER